MPVSFRAASKGVFVGDSITAFGWQNVLVQMINNAIGLNGTAAISSGTASGTATQTGNAFAVAGPPWSLNNPNIVNTGISGDVVAGVAGNISGRITNFLTASGPDVVFLEIGYNDYVFATNPTTFSTNYALILDSVHAFNPNAQILCVSNEMRTEQWTAGSPNLWAFNSVTPDNFAMNPQIRPLVAARPAFCTYLDLSTQELAWQAAHNTPAPGASYGLTTSLTYDGIHPSEFGKTMRAIWAWPYLSVSQ